MLGECIFSSSAIHSSANCYFSYAHVFPDVLHAEGALIPNSDPGTEHSPPKENFTPLDA